MKDITKKLDTRKNSVFELTSLIPQEMPGDIEIVMMKTDKQRTIYVFADWKGLNEPCLMGALTSEIVIGKEVFSFSYDSTWLESGKAHSDPDLQLFSGAHYLNEYPNPGTDDITLDWCNPHETITNSRIEIRNAFGLLIQTLVINNSCSQTVLPVGNWKYGNYFATIYWGNASIKHVSFVIAN